MQKRSILINNHKTSVSLEDAFWSGLKEMALARGLTLSNLASEIDRLRQHGNLSSAMRLAVLAHFREAAEKNRDGGGGWCCLQ